MGQGWRVMMRSPDPALLDHLDAKLWLGPEDRLSAARSAGRRRMMRDQPVLLGAGPITNAAQGPVPAGRGRCRTARSYQALERIWLLFDGADPQAVQAARGQWTRLTGWGLAAQYWSDETGSWVKKTDKPAAPQT